MLHNVTKNLGLFHTQQLLLKKVHFLETTAMTNDELCLLALIFFVHKFYNKPERMAQLLKLIARG